MKSESQVASRGRQIGVTRLNGRPESVAANKSPESGKLSKERSPAPGKAQRDPNGIVYCFHHIGGPEL